MVARTGNEVFENDRVGFYVSSAEKPDSSKAPLITFPSSLSPWLFLSWIAFKICTCETIGLDCRCAMVMRRSKKSSAGQTSCRFCTKGSYVGFYGVFSLPVTKIVTSTVITNKAFRFSMQKSTTPLIIALYVQINMRMHLPVSCNRIPLTFLLMMNPRQRRHCASCIWCK